MRGDIGAILRDARFCPRPFASLLDHFPPIHRDFVSRSYSPRQQSYIASILSDQDLAAVHNPEEYLVLALVNRMPPARWKKYEREYAILDFSHFMIQQIPWIRDEQWYLGIFLNHTPSTEELDADFNFRMLGNKFRAYYVLKYRNDPTKVRRQKPREVRYIS